MSHDRQSFPFRPNLGRARYPFVKSIIFQKVAIVMKTVVSFEARRNMKTYLPMRIESVIPQEIAGTDAPLYSALGPFN